MNHLSGNSLDINSRIFEVFSDGLPDQVTIEIDPTEAAVNASYHNTDNFLKNAITYRHNPDSVVPEAALTIYDEAGRHKRQWRVQGPRYRAQPKALLSDATHPIEVTAVTWDDQGKPSIRQRETINAGVYLGLARLARSVLEEALTKDKLATE